MKKLLLIAVALLTFCTPSFSAVTTSDGSITLDFYEDTQSGIDNRWILNMSFNDFDGLGGVEELKFDLTFWNTIMDFNNSYNSSETDYYSIGYYSTTPSPGYPATFFPSIGSNANKLWIPVDTTFLFYAMPEVEGELIIDTFDVRLYYGDNLGNYTYDDLQLTGPVAFVPVPEPMSMALFVFGACLFKFITKRK